MSPTLKLTIAMLLIACAGCGAAPTPIVDMTGVDQVAYNRDLAACVQENNSKALVLGNGVTRCMQAKGYKVLQSY